MTRTASTLARVEKTAVALGALVALCALVYASRGAFEANMAWTKGAERIFAFLFTVASISIVGVVVMAPYVLLYLLGRVIPKDGSAVSFQLAGVTIAALSTIATVWLDVLALEAVERGEGSTSALVIVVAPTYLLIAIAVTYGTVLWLHARASSKSAR